MWFTFNDPSFLPNGVVNRSCSSMTGMKRPVLHITPSLILTFQSPSILTRRLSRVRTSILQPTLQPRQMLCCFHIGFFPEISTPAVNQGAGWANLDAGSAADAGAFRLKVNPDQQPARFRAAFFKTEREITDQFSAGTHAAAAEDAAVVFHNNIRVGCIHGNVSSWAG